MVSLCKQCLSRPARQIERRGKVITYSRCTHCMYLNWKAAQPAPTPKPKQTPDQRRLVRGIVLSPDRPRCSICHVNAAKRRGTTKDGKSTYRSYCSACRRQGKRTEPKRQCSRLTAEQLLERERIAGPIQRPPCQQCGIKPSVYKGLTATTRKHNYGKFCYACQRAHRESPDYVNKRLSPEEHARRLKLGVRNGNGRNRYRLHLKDLCERCGFIPEEYCQLVIHHLDENHNNNNPLNLQTLCHNCHNLIHFRSRKATSTTC